MDIEQADTEAKKLWGPRAAAQPCQFPGYVEIVYDNADLIGWDVKKWGPTYAVIGWGQSYEEAIENGKNKQYYISKSDPVQMDFFNLW